MNFDLLIKCGNWAGYVKKDGPVYCGWMNFHHDLDGQGATESRPIMSINVLYADEDAFLVHRVEGKFVSTKMVAGQTYTFNGARLHALLPKSIAEECVSMQSIKPQRKIFKENKDFYGGWHDEKVRMYWTWND